MNPDLPKEKIGAGKSGRSFSPGLADSVRYLKGVGPRLGEKLGQKEIFTLADLLLYLPYRYEDRRELKKISRLKPGEKAVTSGKVVASGKSGFRRRPTFSVVIDDGTGALTLKWFRLPGNYLEEKLQKGRMVVASSVARSYDGGLELHHPELEILNEGEDLDSWSFGRIVPVYSLPEGFSQKSFRSLVARAIESCAEQLPELTPREMSAKNNWPLAREAVRNIHFPRADADLKELEEHRTVWHRALYYEEFFVLELALALSRREMVEAPAYLVRAGDRPIQQLRELLGFSLTPAQERVIREISGDLARRRPMHRLLQGDVGSGKTVVALFSALRAISSGLQVAIMAPSEVLAEQHWLVLHRWLDRLGIESGLLTSAIRGDERRQILERTASAQISLLVGTQALIQEKVEFARLGLAIIDEQHRFGVRDRLLLKSKGAASRAPTVGGTGRTPHILVMTATPIPRSLAMTAYGDLDISLLDQMPPGRKPAQTRLLSGKDEKKAWSEIKKRCNLGEQAFVVYPLVEESAKLELQDATRKFEELSAAVFPEFKLGLLHGRLAPEEKERVMEKFRAGQIQVLIATTVIEVGIDVPNATVMVVEHAERFGLSQLHQLRGRVARSAKEAVCFLIAHPPLTDSAKERLQVMTETTDGFKISETDLRLRGPGEFFGTAQSGLPPFRFADLIRDLKELALARNDAFAFADTVDLNRPDLAPLKKELLQKYGKLMHLARVG